MAITSNTQKISTTSSVPYDSGTYTQQNFIEVSGAGNNIYAFQDLTAKANVTLIGQSGDVIYVEATLGDFQAKQSGKNVYFQSGDAVLKIGLSSLSANKTTGTVTTTVVFLDGSVTLSNKAGSTKVSINGYNDDGNAKSQALTNKYADVTVNPDGTDDDALNFFVDSPINTTTEALTTSIDTINFASVVGATSVTSGLQDATAGASTWNTGDSITGNNLTTVSLIGNGQVAAASIVNVVNVAAINVNLVDDTELSAGQFTNVAAVNVTNGVTDQTLTVQDATLSTTYGVSSARSYGVSLEYAGATGTADTAKLSAGGTGTSTTSTAFDVSTGNVIEAVTLATSGTNYLALDGGTGAATITVTGAGTNEVTLAGAASTLTYDASATTGNNTLVFGAQLSTADVIKGGTGVDLLEATVSTAGQFLTTITGMETVDLNFTAAGIFNAVNTSGATTLEVQLSANATVTNLNAAVATILLEETDATSADTSITYATNASSAVVVNVGDSDTSSSTTLAVDIGDVSILGNSGALTINSIGEAANAIDALVLSKSTTVTVNAASKGLEVGGTSTLSKATNVSLNATAGDLSFIGDITAAVDLTTLNLSANGTGNVLTIDGGANGFIGSKSISNINLTATAAGSIVVDGILWEGVDVDGSSVSTAITISAAADSSATISALDAGTAPVTVSTLTASGAGDVTVNGITVDVTLTSVASTVTGNFTLDAGDIVNATTISLGNVTTGNENTVTTGDGADYVQGGTGVDLITTGAGADVILSGGGADIITGGADNDNLTFATGVQKAVFVSGGATTIADYDTANGSDTILSFATGSGGDIVKFEQALKAMDTTTTIAYQVGEENTAIAIGTTVYELAGSTTDGTASGLVTGLGTAATNATLDSGDALVFVNYTTTGDAQLWYFVDANGSNVDAAELTLIGTLSSVTADSFIAGNITA